MEQRGGTGQKKGGKEQGGKKTKRLRKTKQTLTLKEGLLCTHTMVPQAHLCLGRGVDGDRPARRGSSRDIRSYISWERGLEKTGRLGAKEEGVLQERTRKSTEARAARG